MTASDETRNVKDLTALLAARMSERDSAQLALSAAMTGVVDATELLDAAQTELRRAEAEINERRVGGSDTTKLERKVHDARDTVSQAEIAVHEANRVIDEYRDEVNRLDAMVRNLETQMRAAE